MYASPTMQICKRKDENTVSDTFDSYYDLQPYHSFRELEFYEGKIPLEEDDLPAAFLATTFGCYMRRTRRLPVNEMYPNTGEITAGFPRYFLYIPKNNRYLKTGRSP